MERKIPLTFESIILSSPSETVSENNPNLRRAKVRAFSKYANRNGSYITDQMAEKLIESAIDQPVVGWYDPQTEKWAGHVGPALANAYGYIESFVGWQPFTDTDGISRDYAVFSVVLFTDYYNAAKQIVGSNQSMELNPESIKGDWVQIGEDEYFVFTEARIFSFCVIGEKEPCFSVSAFFSKNEGQFEKLKNLVFEMRKVVDECQCQGGNNPMENEMLNNVEDEIVTPAEAEEVVEEQPVAESENYELAEEEAATEEETEVEAEAETEVNETEEVVEAESEEEVVEEEEQPVVEEVFEAEAEEQSEPTQEEVNYQALYEQNNAQLEDLRAKFDEAQNRIAELENTNAQFTATLKNLNTQLESYRAAEEAAIEAKKNELFELYTNSLSEDEVAKIRNQVNTLTYDELETKLALAFSRKQLGQSVETVKVPLIDTQESEFALFMKKYKK